MNSYWSWLATVGGPDTGKIVITAALSALGALIVGIVAATASTALGIWRDRRAEDRSRRRAEKYTAALLCSALDLFINECLDAAIDHGTLDSNLHLTPRLPYPMLIYQKEVDWTTIGDGVMYAAISLVGEVDSGKRAVEWEAVRSTPPVKNSFFEERVIRVCEVGLKASILLIDVKTRYRVATQDRADVDLVHVFSTVLAQTEQRRAERKRAEAQQRIAEALSRGAPVPEPVSDATRALVEALLKHPTAP